MKFDLDEQQRDFAASIDRALGAADVPAAVRAWAGAMPAWGEEAGGELSDVQILSVVCYERYGLGGGDVTSQEYLDYCAPDAPNFALVESGGFAAANIPIKLNG